VSTSRTDGRRTDTRERIRATALELFVRQGYELTTLAQVAHRLEITRPAVYYHFRSKEEVLTSSYQEVTSLLDAIISGDRAATLDRTIELFSGSFRLVLACMFVNERALAGTAGAVTMLARLDELASRLAPTAGAEGKMRGRLALSALTMATARGAQLGGTDEERLAAARTVVHTLLSGNA
jgi:AcrR family transcriptional regulator